LDIKYSSIFYELKLDSLNIIDEEGHEKFGKGRWGRKSEKVVVRK